MGIEDVGEPGYIVFHTLGLRFSVKFSNQYELLMIDNVYQISSVCKLRATASAARAIGVSG